MRKFVAGHSLTGVGRCEVWEPNVKWLRNYFYKYIYVLLQRVSVLCRNKNLTFQPEYLRCSFNTIVTSSISARVAVATINDLHPSANGLHFQQFLCSASHRPVFPLRNFLQRKTALLHRRTGSPSRNLISEPSSSFLWLNRQQQQQLIVRRERSDTFKQNFRS